MAALRIGLVSDTHGLLRPQAAAIRTSRASSRVARLSS